MNKELEALKEIKDCLFWSEEGLNKISIIEKSLKALEIIKKKFFTDELMTYSDLYKYGLCIDSHVSLTQEEYELLKEALL